jgi:putative transposase
MEQNAESARKSPAWPHAPIHQLAEPGTYFVTAGTYKKNHHFFEKKRLDVLQRGLLKVANDAGWQLEAWAIFPNHYHFVGHSPAGTKDASGLTSMLSRLHRKTARWVNQLDGAIGRQVWHNYRETRLTHETSYLARLNYCHQNAVKHGVVPVASQYPWCSAGWFERTATHAQQKTIYGIKTDKVHVHDEYEVPKIA